MIKKAVRLVAAFLLSDGDIKMTNSDLNAKLVVNYLLGGISPKSMTNNLFGLPSGLTKGRFTKT